jgi:hypothetical protein
MPRTGLGFGLGTELRAGTWIELGLLLCTWTAIAIAPATAISCSICLLVCRAAYFVALFFLFLFLPFTLFLELRDRAESSECRKQCWSLWNAWCLGMVLSFIHVDLLPLTRPLDPLALLGRFPFTFLLFSPDTMIGGIGAVTGSRETSAGSSKLT